MKEVWVVVVPTGHATIVRGSRSDEHTPVGASGCYVARPVGGGGGGGDTQTTWASDS